MSGEFPALPERHKIKGCTGPISALVGLQKNGVYLAVRGVKLTSMDVDEFLAWQAMSGAMWASVTDHHKIRSKELEWKFRDDRDVDSYRRTLAKLATACVAEAVLWCKEASISDVAVRVTSAEATAQALKVGKGFHAMRFNVREICERLGPEGYGLLEYESEGRGTSYRIRPSELLEEVFTDTLAPATLDICRAVSGSPRTVSDGPLSNQSKSRALATWKTAMSAWRSVAKNKLIRQVEKRWDDRTAARFRRTLIHPHTASTVQFLVGNYLIEPELGRELRETPAELAAQLCYTGEEADAATEKEAEVIGSRKQAEIIEREKAHAIQAGKETPSYRGTSDEIRKIVQRLGPDGYGLLDYPVRTRSNSPYHVRITPHLLQVIEDSVLPPILESCRRANTEIKK